MLGINKTYKINIVGNGRSGTNWIGRILASSKEIEATIEKDPVFEWSKRVALNEEKKQDYYNKIVWYYRWYKIKSYPNHYLDKSHTNLWIAKDLLQSFSDILFIAMVRNPYATVSSMLKHEGVLSWHKNWKKYPIPNKFLGITKNVEKKYDNISMAKKCSLRWKSHYKKVKKLNSESKKFMVVKYENLVTSTKKTIKNIEDFLELNEEIRGVEPNYKSLDKWINKLNRKQIKDIYEVTDVNPKSVSTFRKTLSEDFE